MAFREKGIADQNLKEEGADMEGIEQTFGIDTSLVGQQNEIINTSMTEG